MLSLLPVTAPMFKLYVGEDWRDGVLFQLGGVPIDVSTIAFEADLYAAGATSPTISFSTDAGTMLAIGACLQLQVSASALAGLAAGAYRVLMFGAEDGARRLLWDGRLALVAGGS